MKKKRFLPLLFSHIKGEVALLLLLLLLLPFLICLQGHAEPREENLCVCYVREARQTLVWNAITITTTTPSSSTSPSVLLPPHSDSFPISD